LQSEHLDHVNALHEQLTAMTAERDSETRWAKQYSDEADELRQQLAAAQESTLGPWFLTQGLCTLDAIADHIITLQRQLTAAQERNTKLQSEHLDHVYALHEQLTAANAEIERGLWDAINNPPEQEDTDELVIIDRLDDNYIIYPERKQDAADDHQ